MTLREVTWPRRRKRKKASSKLKRKKLAARKPAPRKKPARKTVAEAADGSEKGFREAGVEAFHETGSRRSRALRPFAPPPAIESAWSRITSATCPSRS
jgi:hypothetical protein